MQTFDDVARLAAELPAVTEFDRRGSRVWDVDGRAFAWERPFTKADIKRFGAAVPPAGPILAVRVGDEAEKEAVIAADPDAFFTISHFDGFAAVLIQLERVTETSLRDALVDAWLARAPEGLVTAYLAHRPPG